MALGETASVSLRYTIRGKKGAATPLPERLKAREPDRNNHIVGSLDEFPERR